MRLATHSDFYDGPIYTHYRHHEGYAKRAQLLIDYPDPILIVGCGFGFLIEELLKLGKQSWGIDASEYAVNNRVTERVIHIDILDPSPLGCFASVVTEDLLPCLTDAEAVAAAANCSRLSKTVLHLVTEHGEADLNYHSLDYWMTLTHQLTLSLEGM